MTEYDFTQTPCEISSLLQKIQLSSISSATFSHVNLFGNQVSVFFNSPLSSADQTILAAIVASNTGIAINAVFNEISKSTNTSTNSGLYEILDGMTSPALLFGIYQCTFSGTFSTTVPLFSDPGVFLSLFVGGTQIATSQTNQNSTTANSAFNVSFVCKVALNDNQSISVQWKNNGTSNTLTCTNRIFDILKVV
jgi:hypothetical protein